MMALMDSSDTMIFDRRLYRSARERIAPDFASVAFLKEQACLRLADRLDDINRVFGLALDLGCHDGHMARTVATDKVSGWVHADMAERFVRGCPSPRLVADEELLPFADNSFDLVTCAMNLHMVNDLAGCFIQIRRILKPDGLFLAIMPGSRTLHELRESFVATQTALHGGLSPVVAPFIEVRDGGALLQRAGFALPVVDTDILELRYASPLALMRELKAMGEQNVMHDRQRFLPRALFAAACTHYAQHYTDADTGHICASIELVTLTGWKPHTSQQQPLARGSGKISLGDALK